MTLSLAILTVDECIEDCTLVPVNLNRVSTTQTKMQIRPKQCAEKPFFYLSEEVGPHFLGSDRVTTWAASITPTDVFPTLYFI